MDKTKKILLVDDHLVVRAGVKTLIDAQENFKVDGEVSSAKEALVEVASREWDLVLLDLFLPDGDGLTVLDEIRKLKPTLPVLIFSSAPEDQYALAAVQRGAAGFLCKDATSQEMCYAIAQAVSGERYVGKILAGQLLNGVAPNRRALPHEVLSRREFEIMVKIAAGRSLTSIGAELNISVKTVSTHRTNILEKMGLHTNADLTVYALANHLIAKRA